MSLARKPIITAPSTVLGGITMITGMNGTYSDSTHGIAYPRILVCMLTLNSASTVTHALRGRPKR